MNPGVWRLLSNDQYSMSMKSKAHWIWAATKENPLASSSISLGISLFEWFCCRDLCISVVTFGQIWAHPSCPTCEMVFFFSKKTSSWHFSISANLLNPSNTTIFFTLKQWISRYYRHATNLYNKTWPRTDPMEEFLRNGCRSTQPAIWRSLRGVMESATCCRTTRHRGMVKQIPITRVNSGKNTSGEWVWSDKYWQVEWVPGYELRTLLWAMKSCTVQSSCDIGTTMVDLKHNNDRLLYSRRQQT